MNPAEWDHIYSVFHAARDKSGNDRVLLLDESCGENTLLRKAVEELLKEDAAASGFLSEPFFRPSTTRTEPRITAGQHIGRYVTIALIGRGGMGEVWSAHDSDLDRTVALKFLSSEAIASLDTTQITREAKAASALNHPGIVTIHEVVQSGSTLAIVMELVQGAPLRDLCGKPRATKDLLSLGRQIAEALAAAHAAGTVHGDIKPENILLRNDRYVKIVDFGLARKVTTETLASGLILGLGTLRYMSPEQARGGELTPASDIFSFGLLLYELAAGRHPFAALSALEAMEAIRNRQPASPLSVNPAMPPRVARLIMQMLAKNPADRPSAQTVAQTFTALEAGTVAHRLLWKLLAAGAVFLVAIAALAIWKWNKPPVINNEEEWLARPLTSDPGDEMGASFSPDGKQVAFVWRQEDESVFNLYTMPIDGGTPRRLVNSPSAELGPAWSPDGKNIAFIEGVVGGPASIMMLPAAGGTPRKIGPILTTARIEANRLAWSADGNWLVYSDRDPAVNLWCIFALAAHTGQRKRLAAPSPGRNYLQPAISPDGRKLAFSDDGDGVSSLRIQSLGRNMQPQDNSSPLKLPGFESVISGSPMWMPDGFRLLFLSNKNGSGTRLWSVDTRGSLDKVHTPRMMGSLGDGVMLTALSRAGNHLAFTKLSADDNVWLVDLDGKREEILSSTQQERFPQYSPDGRFIAFESDRSGFPEVWVANRDGTHAFALTNFRGPVTGSPAWSRDSKQIAFDTRAAGQPQIFLINAAPGSRPHQLTDGPGSNMLPVWSADGQFIYFNSDRVGDMQIWKVGAAGGKAEQVTTHFAFQPRASPDGKYLYFMAERGESGTISRLDLQTHREETILNPVRDRCFSPTSQGLYYLQRADATSQLLRFWDSGTRKDTVIARIKGRSAGGLSASPDGHSLLIVMDDKGGMDLMIVDDFK
jgi:Tol biopolymer transport system component